MRTFAISSKVSNQGYFGLGYLGSERIFWPYKNKREIPPFHFDCMYIDGPPYKNRIRVKLNDIYKLEGFIGNVNHNTHTKNLFAILHTECRKMRYRQLERQALPHIYGIGGDFWNMERNRA